MTKWTQKDIDRLKQKGIKVEDNLKQPNKLFHKTPKRKSALSSIVEEPEALRYIKNILTILKVKFETEYKFHPTRKFRFDIAFPEHKIAIEYEGLNSEKSRHTSITGYTGDCRKYNLAQSLGWRVLRYTVVNYKEFYRDLEQFLKQ